MVVRLVLYLTIVGKFAFGHLKLLLAMVAPRYGQFLKIHMFVAKKDSLSIPKTADGSLPVSIIEETVL